MSQKLRDWWTSGGFFQVGTILLVAGITWGTTTATNTSDNKSVAKSLDALIDQVAEIKKQIDGVRSAQDGVLKLQGELAAMSRRVDSLETDYKTQIQLNAALQADIAGLKADVMYLRRN